VKNPILPPETGGPPEGLLLVNKPRGPSSHAVVAGLRRALGQPRAGHTGTLDPEASGLLVVLLGRATRIGRYLPEQIKEYDGTIALGLRTATDDAAGEVLSRWDGPMPADEAIAHAAAALTGTISQRPPDFSAKKVGGVRSYRRARRGKSLDLEPVEVVVREFRIERGSGPIRGFRASVSTGTYIRALARDLGEALGCGASLHSLRRVASGPFRLGDALDPGAPPATLRERVLPPAGIPVQVPTVTLEPPQATAFLCGRAVSLPPDAHAQSPGPVRVLSDHGTLLGFAESAPGPGGAVLSPRVVLQDREDGPPGEAVI